MRLRGKVAIVTGAGRGLARAAAVTMGQEGADLVIVSRTPRELEETASMIIDGTGESSYARKALREIMQFQDCGEGGQ